MKVEAEECGNLIKEGGVKIVKVQNKEEEGIDNIIIRGIKINPQDSYGIEREITNRQKRAIKSIAGIIYRNKNIAT